MIKNNKAELLLILHLLLINTIQYFPILSTSSAHPSYDDTLSCDLTLKPARREEYDGGRIIDIKHFYREDMPYGDSKDWRLGELLWLRISMKNGSLYNGSEMKLPGHAGTHADAPGHMFQEYFEAGFDIDTLDLEVLNGK